MRRIDVDIPEELATQVDEVVAEMDVELSQFVARALENHVLLYQAFKAEMGD